MICIERLRGDYGHGPNRLHVVYRYGPYWEHWTAVRLLDFILHPILSYRFLTYDTD